MRVMDKRCTNMVLFATCEGVGKRTEAPRFSISL
jgi:hypothetical protein